MGNQTWTASVQLLPSYWSNVALTWTQTTGLSVYIDGQPAGSDSVGSPRVAYLGQFDPFTDIVIGGKNDDVDLVMRTGKIGVWRVEHIDRAYSAEEMVILTGRFCVQPCIILNHLTP